jgi:D-alanyl-D-alanine carboxypeptidase (penicillin-binding protein 5/6)
VIGKVVASSNGKPVGEAPLVAQADVERAGFMLRGWQHVTALVRQMSAAGGASRSVG